MRIRFIDEAGSVLATGTPYVATAGDAGGSVSCESDLDPSAAPSDSVDPTNVRAPTHYLVGEALTLTAGTRTVSNCSVTVPIAASNASPFHTLDSPSVAKSADAAGVGTASLSGTSLVMGVNAASLTGTETFDATYQRGLSTVDLTLRPQTVLKSIAYRLSVVVSASGDGHVPAIPDVITYDTAQGRGSQPVAGAGCYLGTSARAEITASNNAVCVKATDGRFRCWGDGASDRFAGNGSGGVGVPLVMTNLGSGSTEVRQIALGGEHACALRADGSVICWGQQDSGRLGNGSTGSALVSTPFAVALPGAAKAVRVEVPGVESLARRTCSILETGALACWGFNTDGLLDPGPTAPSSPSHKSTPTIMGAFGASADTKVTSVAMGGTHICVALRSGKVQCWGGNGKKQAGQASGSFLSPPTDVGVFGSTDDLKAVSVVAGREFTCALTRDGKMWCWGANEYDANAGSGEGGMLGVGDTGLLHSAVPLRVGTFGDTATTKVQAIAAGAVGPCALLVDGTVWCWGEGWGQFGVGNDSNQFSPVRFASATVGASTAKKAVALATSPGVTCVVLADGTIGCSGGNSYGSLGNGSPWGNHTFSYVLNEAGTATRTDAQRARAVVPSLAPVP